MQLKLWMATGIMVAITLSAVAQTDNPYAIFGHEAELLTTPQERLNYMLLIPNIDTSSQVAFIGIAPNEGKVYGFDRGQNVISVDNISREELARFFSVDPLTAKYPELTPYQFASNTPIWAIDLDGLERLIYTKKMLYHENVNKKITWYMVANSGRLEWINDPNSQDVKYDHETHTGGGPIPEGYYFISLDNTGNRLNSGDYSGGAWGKYAIRLDYGSYQGLRLKLFFNNRSGFYLHEDGNQFSQGGLGSGGCIACLKGSDILRVKEQILEYYNEGLDKIDVLVDYDFVPKFDYTDYTINTKESPLRFFSSSKAKTRVDGQRNIPKGSLVKGTGITDNGYTEVIYNGKTGWVQTKYLKQKVSSTKKKKRRGRTR